jgi:hypothetical protein
MPPTPITHSWVSLCNIVIPFRKSAGKRTPQPSEALLVVDDTVESLIILTDFYYQEGSYGIEDGKSPLLKTDYLGK